MARQHKAPQYNVACAECMKIHPSSSIAGLQKEAEERIAKESQNIDHERSFMNLTIHGLDVSGNPVVNQDKPERSLEERIYGRINEVGAKVRFDKQETSVERGHNSKESVICEGIIFQVSHERSMEILAEDGMLDENGQIRKDRELPEDSKMYYLFMDTYRFACERFGADNVVGAYIHLDEYTPHMHLFVVPVTMKESRYAGKVRLDEHGKPIMKGVLDAKNIFSPTTIKQLWADYAKYIEKYGVSKAEGKVPKGMYTEVATMDAVVEQKQELIDRQENNLKVQSLTRDRLKEEIGQDEKTAVELKADIAEKKQRCDYLGLQIRDREAELGTVLKKLQTTSSLGRRPEKGVLGYRSDDVENYVEAAEAKDRIRQITRTQTDDLPTRKAMWEQLEKQKPLLAEYYSLINDPDALIRKAQEVKDAQFRNTMYGLAKAALGGNLVPKQFSYEDSPAGRECVVVGSTEFSGEHRAVHILPDGRVFSTDSSSVKDVKTARMHPYPQIWIYHGTIDDLYLQIQIERMINATLVTPIHFTGFEKQENSNGPEYLFYGSNCINYYRDVHENVISSYYKNIPDIKTCHDRIGDRIWKREITVTEVKNANEFRSQGNGMKKG